MAGNTATGPGARFTGMPARGESSQALLGGGGPGRKAVSLICHGRVLGEVQTWQDGRKEAYWNTGQGGAGT
jgi:hypothetical protein